LDEVAKVILQEQDEVQKDFDSVDEQLEYLRQCLEKFESLNVLTPSPRAHLFISLGKFEGRF